MKEYEYIVAALEGYLCEELTGVICSENYRNKSYEHGYRRIFNEYRSLHDNFVKNKERFSTPSLLKEVSEEFYQSCRLKSEASRTSFLKDLQACTDVDMERYMNIYLSKLEADETETVTKRVCLYPYLVSVLKTTGKGAKTDGKEF